MRILVTGGAGYIGSVAVERLLQANHFVSVLDNFWHGHRYAVEDGAALYNCDLRDAASVAHHVKIVRPDAVLHFAGATLVPESVREPATYFGINVSGAHNLLEALRQNGVSKIVFSSTAAVYGTPRDLPITESAPLQPISPYGQSKLIVEQMLEAYANAYGFRYAALRYFNVAGATAGHGEDHRPETHAIPVALQVLLGKQERFSVFGTDYPTPDGTAIRDYVHVVDLVDAHLLALDRLDQSLGPINLGTRAGFSVKQVVTAIEETTGRELPVAYGPRRVGDPPALIADSTKARHVLGWEPTHSTLPKMIGSAWDWMQRHPDGYSG